MKNKIINHTKYYRDPNELIKCLWTEYGTVGAYSHYITIQLPKHRRRGDLDRAKQEWRKIMACFEYNLLGRHWNKNHLRFFGCAAKHLNGYWHYHLLIESRDSISNDDIINAICATRDKQSLISIQLHIEPILGSMADIQNVLAYTGNHIRVTHKTHLDTTRFIMSDELLEKRD